MATRHLNPLIRGLEPERSDDCQGFDVSNGTRLNSYGVQRRFVRKHTINPLELLVVSPHHFFGTISA